MSHQNRQIDQVEKTYPHLIPRAAIKMQITKVHVLTRISTIKPTRTAPIKKNRIKVVRNMNAAVTSHVHNIVAATTKPNVVLTRMMVKRNPVMIQHRNRSPLMMTMRLIAKNTFNVVQPIAILMMVMRPRSRRQRIRKPMLVPLIHQQLRIAHLRHHFRQRHRLALMTTRNDKRKRIHKMKTVDK